MRLYEFAKKVGATCAAVMKMAEEKGVEVKIVTAASNTYEEKLKSEMSKSSAPTLFQVNGPTGLKN